MIPPLHRARRGDFGFRPLVATYDPAVTDGAPTDVHFGLPLFNTWLYGTWRGPSGRLWQAHRTLLGQDASVGNHLFAATDGDGDRALRTWQPPEGKGWHSGKISHRPAEDAYVIAASTEHGYAGGQPFESVRTLDALTWTDGEHMDLEGRRIGPALNVYVPNPDDPLLYTSYVYRASGTIAGEPVEGWMWSDQCYLRPGQTWRGTEYFRRVELAWTPFATEYDDGTMLAGHVCYGADGFCWAGVFDGDGTVLHCGTDVEGRDIVFDDATFPRSMTYRVDGTDYGWTADPDGQLPDMVGGQTFYRSAEGLLHPAGDGRTPVVWSAFNEFFPDDIAAWHAAGAS